MKLRSLLRRQPTILLLYTVLALLLSWPLIAKITTHVPGVAQWAFDESTFLWNIWYLKHSLVDTLSNPLHSDLIWYPLGIDLVLYTYNFFHALLAFPLALAVNIPFSNNLALLLSTVLSGYGTFLLIRYLLNSELRVTSYEENRHLASLAAFAAGIVYAFASNRAIYATLGHYNFVTTQWIPFYVLMLLRALDANLTAKKRRSSALLAGIFFAFSGLAEMTTALFLALFTLLVMVVYLPKLFNRNLRSKEIPAAIYNHPISNLFLIGLVAFLLWSPVLLPVLRQLGSEDFSVKGWGETIPLSSDLFGWFTPTVLHPIFGSDLVTELTRVKVRAIDPDGSGFRDINTVFLGWVTLGLALIGAIAYRRKVRLWSWTALIFGIFTLGPFLQLNGQYRFNFDGEEVTFPLPFLLLHYLPIIKANRAPNRNSLLLMLVLAVLVGYGLFWLMRRLRDWEIRRLGKFKSPNLLISQSLISSVLAFFLLFEHLALPLPLSDARIPALYQQIADDPRPVSVLQLPLGWRDSFEVLGPEETLLQYYQSAHGKAMLGGNTSRAPAFKLDYFRRLPFFQALTQIEFGHPVAQEVLDAARAEAAQLVQLYNLGYVILYPPIPDRKPYEDNWQASWDFVKQTLPLEPQPFWAEEGIEAYRVQIPARSDEMKLDLGTSGNFPYLGEGWDSAASDTIYDQSALWATATTSRFFLPMGQIDPDIDYQVSLRLHPFAYPGAAYQSATLLVNGERFSSQPLVDGWQTLTWSVPGRLWSDGLNRLEIDWAQVASPRQVLGDSRTIGTTGVTLPIDVEVNAFSEGAFIALYDETGTQIDGSAGRAGVNVTVLDPASGAIVAKKGFDTTANQFESQALVDFLQQITPGFPVIVASRGNATNFLTLDAIEALRTLGTDVTEDKLKGQFFAILGVKGTQPGSAQLEVGHQGAYLSLSLNRDRRTLAAAVDWVVVTK
ncbi:MAG: interleukin-like EMT inducer domain-containing protein [Caldilineaceae bacterium]